ncbi:MAG TPA: amidase [Burkholderiales bacterium]|nr:amidase [Burkholderiales bacterium]
MTEDELCNLDLIEAGRLVQRRDLSCVELTQAQLDRIERLDGRLRSYATLTADTALAQARRADDEIRSRVIRGPLHGVPIAVKDLCNTQGIATAAGMAIHKRHVPERDATVVARLKASGAVLLGKLQMTEGAMSTHHPSIQPPVNPWGEALWPGVSSSGSGVATAACLCFGSLGSDTLGSIRFPSTMNGLTGLKPTWGRVSRAGVFPLAESLDHIGPMTRSAADAAAMLGAIAGPDADDPTALKAPVPDYLDGIDGGVRGLRVGIDHALNAAGTDEGTVRASDAACAVLSRLGAAVRDVAFPSPDDVARDAVLLCAIEAAAAHEATYPARAAEYGPVFAAFLETGRGLDASTVVKIRKRRAEFSGRVAALFKEIDVLIVPALNRAGLTLAELSPNVANPAQARIGRVRFTAPFDMTGSPALVLPGGRTAQGLPVGFQMVGRHLEEALLLRAGHAFQQATDWHRHRPPV